jgi:hypothetical protein
MKIYFKLDFRISNDGSWLTRELNHETRRRQVLWKPYGARRCESEQIFSKKLCEFSIMIAEKEFRSSKLYNAAGPMVNNNMLAITITLVIIQIIL